MSITAVSAAQNGATWQSQRAGHGAGMRKAFDAAASALGMSTDDLRSALKGGQSMSSLAEARGVDADDLTSTVATALTGADSSLTSADATAIAQWVVAGPGGGQGRGGPGGGPGGVGGPPPGGPPPAVGQAVDSLASTLGLTSDELQQSLSSGTSLTDVAAASGMDATTLEQTLTAALTAADSSLSGDRAASIAKDLMAGPPKPPDDTYSRVALTRSGGTAGTAGVSQETLLARYHQSSSSWAAAPAGVSL